jgi:hypothetical protein
VRGLDGVGWAVPMYQAGLQEKLVTICLWSSARLLADSAARALVGAPHNPEPGCLPMTDFLRPCMLSCVRSFQPLLRVQSGPTNQTRVMR